MFCRAGSQASSLCCIVWIWTPETTMPVFLPGVPRARAALDQAGPARECARRADSTQQSTAGSVQRTNHGLVLSKNGHCPVNTLCFVFSPGSQSLHLPALGPQRPGIPISTPPLALPKKESLFLPSTGLPWSLLGLMVPHRFPCSLGPSHGWCRL